MRWCALRRDACACCSTVITELLSAVSPWAWLPDGCIHARSVYSPRGCFEHISKSRVFFNARPPPPRARAKGKDVKYISTSIRAYLYPRVLVVEPGPGVRGARPRARRPRRPPPAPAGHRARRGGAAAPAGGRGALSRAGAHKKHDGRARCRMPRRSAVSRERRVRLDARERRKKKVTKMCA